jgi:Nif-specific regulatory protein
MAVREEGDKRVKSERDFYYRLLGLGREQEIEPLLEEALELIVDVTGASKAYIELYDERAGPGFWKGHGCSDEDVDAIRASISRGIIGRAIAEGRTIETPSALDDTRFQDLASVRKNEIQAVLCAPVGAPPPLGVVYLQGKPEGGPFAVVDRERAELFALQLAPLADRLVTRRRVAEPLDYTREPRQRFHCPELVGRSRALAHVLQQASLVAPLDVDVLITGPSGTGKSALARAIALNSRRGRGPFVAVNCAALPETLIENELFGAERGAHSTATRKTTGKVAAAESGTLFLDEIAELPPGAQAKLLHLLHQREYHPLGASTAVKADVRIISATNANLPSLVAAKRFREDLFYRLHVLPLETPGLPDRREDIPEIVDHLCDEVCRRHKLPIIRMSRAASLACREASWPGHIRQLANAIEAAVIRAHGEQSRSVETRHVFPDSVANIDEGRASFQDATRLYQRRYVLEVLERTDWNISETARQLDLARSHVYNLINEFSLRREAASGKPGKS